MNSMTRKAFASNQIAVSLWSADTYLTSVGHNVRQWAFTVRGHPDDADNNNDHKATEQST